MILIIFGQHRLKQSFEFKLFRIIIYPSDRRLDSIYIDN